MAERTASAEICGPQWPVKIKYVYFFVLLNASDRRVRQLDQQLVPVSNSLHEGGDVVFQRLFLFRDEVLDTKPQDAWESVDLTD